MNNNTHQRLQLFCLLVSLSFLFQGSISLQTIDPLEPGTTSISLNNGDRTVKDELIAIQQAIEDSDALWTADYTSTVTLLSVGETIGLGAHNEEPETPDYEPRSMNTSLPEEFDWRNIDQIDWTTSVRNQAGCGSCVAFGVL